MTSLLWTARSRSLPDQPFLTFHDDATGERTELSGATFGNWVAKSANLLVEELQVAPADRVALPLGPHWTTAVLAFACWRVGAAVVPLDPAAPTGTLRALLSDLGARVAAVDETSADAAAALIGSVEVLLVGAGMGARLTGPAPAGTIAFGEEVPAFGDDYDGPGADPDAVALHLPADGGSGQALRLSQRALVAASEALGAHLRPGERLLTIRAPHTVDGLVLGMVAPWVRSASVVTVRNPVPAALGRTIRMERVTCALLDEPLLRSLPRPLDAPTLRAVLVPER